MSRLIQVTGGRWGQGEGHPSALVQADVECWVSASLCAGRCNEERVGTCLGRKVILGMDKEDLCLSHWRQKDVGLVSRGHSAP